MTHIARIELSVVAYQDGDAWIAQCIEHDIAARAPTLTALPRAFERAVVANMCVNHELGREALDGIPAAPEEFRKLFDRADLDLTPRRSVERASHARFRVAEPAVAA